jgi:Xaa-Pro aminopeptidase
MNVSAQPTSGLKIPFDYQRLDRLMDEAGIDVIVATSKHNVQYLLGGHRAHFFDYMDAVAISRYLPVVVYAKGAPANAAFFGNRLEKFQIQADPVWTPETQTVTNNSSEAINSAIAHIRKLGVSPKRIAFEFSFMPYDAAALLRPAFPDADWVDALYVLEAQRAVKSADELRKLKIASAGVIDSMTAVIAKHGPGSTKRELAEALRREETNRGMTFEYCLITTGTSLNRAPTDQVWGEGDILSLDSGGNYHGYIGDICRMAIHGEPDAELVDMLAEIEAIQRMGFNAAKPGALGKTIYASAEPLVKKSKHHNHLDFLVHGMGLVSHEAPRLQPNSPMKYPDAHANVPLEAGMVLSIETTLLHPTRGFIKLEDTVIVTETGHEVYGEGIRGWNRGGTAV